MDDQNQAPHSISHNIYVYIVAVVVVVFLIIGATIVKEFKSPGAQKPPATPTPTAVVRRGTMSLATKAGAAGATNGALITIEVRGDSVGEDIVGLDALVSYNAAKVDYVSAQSAIPTFRVYPASRAGMVSITSVKNLQAAGTTILSNSPVLTLTFRAKAQGSAQFDLMTEREKETTKMINVANVQLRPTVTGVAVEIK